MFDVADAGKPFEGVFDFDRAGAAIHASNAHSEHVSGSPSGLTRHGENHHITSNSSKYRVNPMAAEQLTIGNLAKATDTKVETIRYYERIGLLPAPARTRGNYRSYSPEQLGRLSFIRGARDLGFSLPQVHALLSLSDQRRRSCEAVDTIARKHLTEVRPQDCGSRRSAP